MVPSELIGSLKARAKKLRKTVVLPDATDERALKAARILLDEGVANPVLVGAERDIREKASGAGVSLEKVRIVDPSTSDQKSSFSHLFFNLRKNKGIDISGAEKAMS